MIVREDKAKNMKSEIITSQSNNVDTGVCATILNMKSEIITSQSNNVDTGVCATILGPGSEVGFIISAIK